MSSPDSPFAMPIDGCASPIDELEIIVVHSKLAVGNFYYLEFRKRIRDV